MLLFTCISMLYIALFSEQVINWLEFCKLRPPIAHVSPFFFANLCYGCVSFSSRDAPYMVMISFSQFIQAFHFLLRSLLPIWWLLISYNYRYWRYSHFGFVKKTYKCSPFLNTNSWCGQIVFQKIANSQLKGPLQFMSQKDGF